MANIDKIIIRGGEKETGEFHGKFLCSLFGVTYMNFVDGRPCPVAGNTIVMDNCPFHHDDGKHVLHEFFEDLNIELVFMPTYNPDFNPTEYVFRKMKCSLRHKLWNLRNKDLRLKVYNAINL